MKQRLIDIYDLAVPQSNSKKHGIAIVSWIYLNIDMSNVICELMSYDNKLDMHFKNTTIIKSLIDIICIKINEYEELLTLYIKTIDYYRLRDDTFGPCILNCIPCESVFILFYLIENLRTKVNKYNRVNSLYVLSMQYMLDYYSLNNINLAFTCPHYSNRIEQQYTNNNHYIKMLQFRPKNEVYRRALLDHSLIFTFSCASVLIMNAYDEYMNSVYLILRRCESHLVDQVLSTIDTYSMDLNYRYIDIHVLSRSLVDVHDYGLMHPFRARLNAYIEGSCDYTEFLHGLVMPMCLSMAIPSTLHLLFECFTSNIKYCFENYND